MLQRCNHCGLLALSGSYCAGCGRHLTSRPIITRKQLFGLAVAITFVGVMLGFLLAGALRAPSELQLAVTVAAQDCAGTYSYTAALRSGGESLPNTRIAVLADGALLEQLRTDQNGRLTATHPYPSTWCGEEHTLTAVYRGSALHAETSATAPLIARIPAALALTAQRSAVDTIFTLTLTDSEGSPLPGKVVRLHSEQRAVYGLTNSRGQAFLQVQPAEGERMAGVFVGDESHLPAQATLGAPTLADTVAALQQHVVGVSHSAGSGAGVILAHENNRTLVLTNRHVVDGAQQVAVRFGREETFASAVAYAPDNLDLALLAVSGTHGVAAPLAPLPAYRQGEQVLAIGSPLGLAGSVSSGIISNIGADSRGNRTVTVLQTDAPINPGSSGGGLFTGDGALLGITTAKAASAEGIGFAIDVRVLEQLPATAEWETRTLS